MLFPAILLTLTVGGAGYYMIRRSRKTPAPLRAPEPELSAPLRHFNRAAVPAELAHVTASGPRALAAAPVRVRPGHRCVDEIRRRCHEDFASALNYLDEQLDRRVSDNPLEQARYTIDVAEGLRGLNLHDSVPALLRHADSALDLPLAEGFAAEVSSFAAFAEYLQDPLTPEGQAALRVLRVAMEGVRMGRIPATVYADAAFGDACRRLSENCPDAVNPRLVLVFIEAMRHCRRSFHTAPVFRDDPVRRQTVRWQFAFLRDAEPIMREYLHDIAKDLTRLLERSRGRARKEILRALAELQADTDDLALNLLGDPQFSDRPGAIRCLRWSKSPLARTALCGIARHALTGEKSARWLRRLGIGKKPIPAAEVHATLVALRGHASDESERVLLQYVERPEAEWRKAALESLGWWEPARRGEVLAAVRTARQDASPEIRRAALAVSARLGECQALQMIREMISRENPATSIDAIRFCAAEGLTWLWPDLDQLTELDDAAITIEAWEAVERLRETFLGPLG